MIRSLLLFALLGHAEAVRDMGSALLAEEASMDLDANASQVQAGTVAGAHMASDFASQRARDAASASSEERRRRQEAFKGTTLRGRYVLEELLMAKATPGKSFPTIKEYSGQSPKHLGMGGFGDTWKAWDKTRNSYVAVKIFHNEKTYISWDTATPDERESLLESKYECTIVQDIVKEGLQMRPPYKDYVQYLCQCYADHVEKGTREPAFLVLELCGTDVYSAIILKGRSARGSQQQQDRKLLQERRHIIHDVLKGLSVLQKLDPPLMHHDIKPENICVTDDSKGKLIDFGALMKATENTKKEAAPYSPLYRPPEVATGRTKDWAWKGEPWSYDIYSLGVVYVELLCPAVTEKHWLKEQDGVPVPKKWSPREAISAKCPQLARLGLEPDFKLMEKMISFQPEQRPPAVDCVEEMTKMDDA